jgi:hypothetical protein
MNFSYASRTLRFVLALAIAALALTSAGCRRDVPLYAPPAALEGGLHVRIYKAYVTGDRIYVKSHVTNGGSVPIGIDRDGWALRLPSGEILPRSHGITTRHNIYTVAPGERRDVFVDFHKDDADLRYITEASLIVGGISYGTDPTPLVAGEIPLSVTVPAAMYDYGTPTDPPPPAPAETPAAAQPDAVPVEPPAAVSPEAPEAPEAPEEVAEPAPER